MADTHGHTPDSLIDELVKRPYAFDFFRAVRLLECRRTDLPRVGFSVSPSEDPVRFWQNPSLRFAPSTIESVRADGAGSVPRMAVNFFGLFGPTQLPVHLQSGQVRFEEVGVALHGLQSGFEGALKIPRS